MAPAVVTWYCSLCWLLVAAVGSSTAAPARDAIHVHPTPDKDEAMLRATLNDGSNLTDLVEGDIRVLPGVGHGRRHRRQMVNVGYMNFYYIWPGGIVPYSISSSYQASSVAVIQSAIADIQQKTCVKFFNVADYARDYFGNNSLNIYPGSGCWSYIGNINWGAQDVSLAEAGCLYGGVVQHELMHALGFVHTQSRPDRDQSVRVFTQNVVAGYEHNFYKRPSPEVFVKIAYDYFSVMHYGATDFTATSGVATIYPKSVDVSKLLGNRVTMSFYDEKAINELYGCSGNCATACQNDGYPRMLDDGSCVCRCPKGLGGPTCSAIDSTNFQCGGIVNLTDGTPVTISSPNHPLPYPTGKLCAWLVQAPPNRIVQISFKKMGLTSDPSKCRHFLDIRKYMIGQPSPNVYCGIGTPNDTLSVRDPKKGSQVLIIFDASDTTVTAGAGFSLTVSSYTDGCLGDPCRGARCSSSPGSASYTCLLPGGDAYCGYETASSIGCKVIRVGDVYDDYSGSVAQVTWDTARSDTSATATTAPEGNFYLASNPLYNEYSNGSRCYGRFRIIPFLFNSDRCLRFQYYIYGDGVGSLFVYRAVNGNLGTPIFTQASGTQADAWNQAEVTVRATGVPTDLIEVVVEAQHSSGNFDNHPIAIDDLRYLAGGCGTGPCSIGRCTDGAQCVPSGSSYTCVTPLPDGDVSSSFESWENTSRWLSFTSPFQLYKWVGPGHAWPRPTGATGPATGLTYLYAPLYNKAVGTTATMRIGTFAGGLRCLRFTYSMYGMDMGSLTVSRVVTTTSGNVLATALWSKKGNQGDAWWGSPAITVNCTLAAGEQKIEVTIVAQRLNVNYGTDMALDDISYTKGACSTTVAVGGPW